VVLGGAGGCSGRGVHLFATKEAADRRRDEHFEACEPGGAYIRQKCTVPRTRGIGVGASILRSAPPAPASLHLCRPTPDRAQVRHHMRKAQLRVNLWLADGQIRAVGCVANVTLGDASIVMANPLPAGLDVELEFLAPEQPRPRVHGTVVSSEGEEMRVHFHDISATELKALERLLGGRVR